MRISNIEIYPVRPDVGDLVPAGVNVGWLFVAVETDEGLTGYGECSNWPSKGDIIVAHMLHTVKEALIGRDPTQIEAIWQTIFRNYTYLGNRGPVTTVISGIDIALWDLKGKATGRSVCDLLGGAVRESIPLYTHPLYGPPEVVAESARQQVAEGYRAVKTDPFWEEMGPTHTARMSGYISPEGVHRGVEIVAALREAVGPEVEILIDAHGHFDVASAIKCARALERFDLTWFEEPVPPESYAALRQVREAVKVPLCTGERLFTRWDFLPVLQERLADYLMCDVCWTGGISELKKVSILAETFYVNMSPHGAMGPLQIFAGAQTMMTVPNFYRLEITSLWLPVFNAALTAPMDIRDGHLHLPEAPGLGVELDMEYVRGNADPDWLTRASS